MEIKHARTGAAKKRRKKEESDDEDEEFACKKCGEFKIFFFCFFFYICFFTQATEITPSGSCCVTPVMLAGTPPVSGPP